MTPRKTHLDTLAYTLLLVCCIFWGFQQVLIKATVPEVPPVFQAAVRFAGATLLLWLWCRWRKVALVPRDGTLGPGLLAGALFAMEFACIYIGLQHTGASRLTVFLYTAPFWVAAVLPFFVASERLRPVQWLGLACAFAAVVFASAGGRYVLGHDHGGHPLEQFGAHPRRAAVVLPNWLQRAKPSVAVDGAGRALELCLVCLCQHLHAGANRGGCVCQLPHLDVALGALPRWQNERFCFPYPYVRSAIWLTVVA
jgi:uncharacterized membrane protein